MIQLIHGNCISKLSNIDAESVDLVVTSPPYDNLRSYGGIPPFDMDAFYSVAWALHYVLKPGGVIVWVVGDATINGSETGTSFRQALYFKDKCGLNIHDTMIYQKNNFANPSSNRYHQIFEYMFVFSKGKPKTFNPIKDRENVCAGTKRNTNQVRMVDGSLKKTFKKQVYSEFGMRNNIWRYVTSKNGQNDEEAYEHPAPFPEALAMDHIKSWSNEGDLVLDPFMGSGTTAKCASMLNRNYIGIELNKDYVELTKRRLDKNGITGYNCS